MINWYAQKQGLKISRNPTVEHHRVLTYTSRLQLLIHASELTALKNH